MKNPLYFLVTCVVMFFCGYLFFNLTSNRVIERNPQTLTTETHPTVTYRAGSAGIIEFVTDDLTHKCVIGTGSSSSPWCWEYIIKKN